MTPAFGGQYSIQLSYGRSMIYFNESCPATGLFAPSMGLTLRARRCATSFKFAPGKFVEPVTPAFGGQYSIQLSYGR